MNRDQSPGLKATCMDDGDTACFIHHCLFSCRGVWKGGGHSGSERGTERDVKRLNILRVPGIRETSQDKRKNGKIQLDIG